ncbi:hypothetical protein [Streptomyces sp. TRM68367]|uniref:hypothetical protein n=1 Tax=Streptomyces sp. TRM68367 TaxID=2758415 RepID=UPI00165CA3FE|nr:hypothetical protein [Streptomyces sp. TRM68367]MBC9727232.1 hypothetical protein [Streptomyces sp. TRM68367]
MTKPSWNLARYAEQNVRGQLEHYDHDGNGLIEYDWGAMTGNDADAVSFDWRPGNLDRGIGVRVRNALAAARAYELLGETAKARASPRPSRASPRRVHTHSNSPPATARRSPRNGSW